MSGFRGSAHDTLSAPARFTVRPITLALVGLLIAATLAVVIMLATSGGGDQPGATESVRVAPSAPTAGDIQRSQPPGVNGPGAHP
jgi:hypothetical protein